MTPRCSTWRYVGLVQGLERATIIEVVVKGYGEVRVSDGGDKHGVFNGRGE